MEELTSNILQILLGIFVLISEILPFIKNVNSNGIIECIIEVIKSLVKKQKSLPNDSLQVIEETEPLLNNTYPKDYAISDKIDELNVTLNNISYVLTDYLNEMYNSKQVKLQPVELYELNYIVNYIKVNYHKRQFQIKLLSQHNKNLLISKGYIVEYDSRNESHIILW